MSKLKWNEPESVMSNETIAPSSLNDLDLDQPIAKGCNAVVYSAKLRKSEYSSQSHLCRITW